jgi:UDP-N-acetylmuramate dehydrogenase
MQLDKHAKKWLSDHLEGCVKFDVPMANYTYFKVGGPADAYTQPESKRELVMLIRYAVENQIPYYVIGGGTNLLVKDSGIRGIVIVLSSGFNQIQRSGLSNGDVLVTVGAGVKLQAFCRYAIENGLAGMNFAIGVPGSTGGAIMMNAGTSNGSMGHNIAFITVLGSNGHHRKIPRDLLSFAYRRLSIPSEPSESPMTQPVILEGCFKLQASDPERLKSEARNLLHLREQKQPLEMQSAGCFFKNPDFGKTAGELIELAGLKGKSVGAAVVSTKHANFIINRGGTTAAEVLKLKDIIQQTVVENFQINLEPEVKIVGE